MYKPDLEIELTGFEETFEQSFKYRYCPKEIPKKSLKIFCKHIWIQSRRQLPVKHGAGIDKLKESVKYIEGNQEEYGCAELLNKLLKEVWDYIEGQKKPDCEGCVDSKDSSGEPECEICFRNPIFKDNFKQEEKNEQQINNGNGKSNKTDA
jgi:hypothetical protein